MLEGSAGVTDAWEKLVGQNLVLGKQAHDANLVATMLVHGVDRLLTFNGDDFKRFESVQIIAPASVTVVP